MKQPSRPLEWTRKRGTRQRVDEPHDRSIDKVPVHAVEPAGIDAIIGRRVVVRDEFKGGDGEVQSAGNAAHAFIDEFNGNAADPWKSGQGMPAADWVVIRVVKLSRISISEAVEEFPSYGSDELWLIVSPAASSKTNAVIGNVTVIRLIVWIGVAI